MIDLGHGIYLETLEEIEANQSDWDDDDPGKMMDFSDYPFWLTTDDGQEPEGYNSVDECKKDLGSDFNHLNWPLNNN